MLLLLSNPGPSRQPSDGKGTKGILHGCGFLVCLPYRTKQDPYQHGIYPMNSMFRATSYLAWDLVVGMKRKTREAESQAKEKKQD